MGQQLFFLGEEEEERGRNTDNRGKCPELNAYTRLPDWEELARPTEVFPLKLETRSRCLVRSSPFNIVLKGLASATPQKSTERDIFCLPMK